ncbi:Anthranilate synthase [Methanoregula boonei 6A8]|jgi:anthranilate synthase component 1|uniref:Anthranilate synthase component 1 n=1 Tax=Methanoregula boonei (strain DSM 21154 / JCM 14090 / 6A8) TaxID=456442 RepID=A7I4T9_METB6|nr:anthranilate synthase component I [Methanoregula boonei]ABS54750.1 Anthranilate synthase [Methanoregula boonei 6A8]
MATDTLHIPLTLNLGSEEYLTAVADQPKPLVIPLCAELTLPQCSPLEVFLATRAGPGFLLESMEGSEKIARYSYMGINPACVITLGREVSVEGSDAFVAIAHEPEGKNPVDRIRSILSRFHYINLRAPRFFGGMVGYFSYDIVHDLFEQVPDHRTKRGRECPDARFMLTKDCIVFDHRDRRLFVFSSPFLTYDTDPAAEYRRCAAHIAELTDRIASVAGTPKKPDDVMQTVTGKVGKKPEITDNTGREAFMHAVSGIKEHIVAGDIFQAVLSRRMECPVVPDPFPIYAALRSINPSPYMYYLDFGDEQVIGASPEMLVRVEKRRVTTVPIAGTRPRGADKSEDKKLAQELLLDKKERAEHTMLVDLARNDLGRVCKFGSVEVSEFMGIEKFSHVQHMVSTVQGTLMDHLDGCDALKSCFPAGTVSGAPKIRAMQIIGESEPDARGIYAGAVGYIGFDRNLEFAIAIRTVTVKDGRASVQAGAGIVADSVPENEWTETENKAAAMMKAIEQAGVVP